MQHNIRGFYMIILVFYHRVMLSYIFARRGLIEVVNSIELLSIVGMNSAWSKSIFLVACGPNLTIKLLSRKVILPSILVRGLSLVTRKYLLPIEFTLVKILGFCHCKVSSYDFLWIWIDRVWVKRVQIARAVIIIPGTSKFLPVFNTPTNVVWLPVCCLIRNPYRHRSYLLRLISNLLTTSFIEKILMRVQKLIGLLLDRFIVLLIDIYLEFATHHPFFSHHEALRRLSILNFKQIFLRLLIKFFICLNGIKRLYLLSLAGLLLTRWHLAIL